MKSLNIIKSKDKAIFTAQEAKEWGISTRMLHHLVKKGQLERIAHGTYILAEASSIDLTNLIQEAIVASGNCIVGHESALYLHDVTDDAPELIHLITPYGNTPKKKLLDVKYHRSRKDLSEFETININSMVVTSFEQTIIDLLKSGETLGTLLNAINRYRASGRAYQLSKLAEIGSKFRCKQKVNNLIEAISHED